MVSPMGTVLILLATLLFIYAPVAARGVSSFHRATLHRYFDLGSRPDIAPRLDAWLGRLVRFDTWSLRLSAVGLFALGAWFVVRGFGG